MMTKTSRNRIDAYRNETTGEITPPHQIGTTQSGKKVFASVEGWEPVAEMEDGTYQPSTGVFCNADGNWVIN